MGEGVTDHGAFPVVEVDGDTEMRLLGSRHTFPTRGATSKNPRIRVLPAAIVGFRASVTVILDGGDAATVTIDTDASAATTTPLRSTCRLR